MFNFKVECAARINNPDSSKSEPSDVCMISDEFCGGSDRRDETH